MRTLVYTPVTVTMMNHTAPGSTCACGCEACLSKLMLVFTSDDPEGPAITRSTLPRHGMHFLLDEAVVPALPLHTHFWMCRTICLIQAGGQSSP